ncbi:MAG TPA: hypothetical protein VJU13_12740 [Candidatus Nitrosocosmicus sp.]|nr:hypothetical protein [Candidatus Nitrosocosmicus sp.]
MKKTLVIATFALSIVLTASLVSKTLDQTVLAQDLSTLKNEATKLLSGNDNSQRTDNNSLSTTDNSTSGGSSLKEKATGMIGGLLK